MLHKFHHRREDAKLIVAALKLFAEGFAATKGHDKSANRYAKLYQR